MERVTAAVLNHLKEAPGVEGPTSAAPNDAGLPPHGRTPDNKPMGSLAATTTVRQEAIAGPPLLRGAPRTSCQESPHARGN
eukprot:2781471-Lingulodinium_polyedra.AAC.1